MLAKTRFHELEGLRAYLALAVVVGHAFDFAPIPVHKIAESLLSPGYAVQSFMILSAFVITHLMLGSHEKYDVYIVRRFARLFPILSISLILAWFTYDLLQTGTAGLPWSNEPEFQPFVAKWHHRADLMGAQPLAHWIAHLTMLHGVVPQELLSEAGHTILAPAWSISLEWQFYLIAPVALYLLQRSWGWGLAFVAVIGGLALARPGILGTFDNAFLGKTSVFLLVGMASRLALPHLAQLNPPALPATVIAVLAVLLLAKFPLDWLPSALVYPSLVSASAGSPNRLYRLILGNPVAVAIGRASYSIYLLHFVVFSVVIYLCATQMDNPERVHVLAVLGASIPVIVGISLLSYHWIERGGVAAGRAWASKRQPSAVLVPI